MLGVWDSNDLLKLHSISVWRTRAIRRDDAATAVYIRVYIYYHILHFDSKLAESQFRYTKMRHDAECRVCIEIDIDS